MFRGLYIYQLSYLHYSTFAFIVVFAVGTFMSFITYDLGMVTKKKIDQKYFFSRSIYSKTKITDGGIATSNAIATMGKSSDILLEDLEQIQKF